MSGGVNGAVLVGVRFRRNVVLVRADWLSSVEFTVDDGGDNGKPTAILLFNMGNEGGHLEGVSLFAHGQDEIEALAHAFAEFVEALQRVYGGEFDRESLLALSDV